MRILKNILILLLGIIFVYSCTPNRHSSYYRNLISKYPKRFIGHFPKYITNGIIDKTDNGEYDVTRLFLLQKLEEDSINKLKDSIEKISLAIYDSNDTCLFIINKFTNEKNYTWPKKAPDNEIYNYLQKECLKNKIPIPNFWGLYEEDFKTPLHLPYEYKIYVLESRKGLYWDKKHRSNGEYMPDDWKHGYSKGVAMNDKTHEIIYWFVLW